jgi:outer membrane protein assembly factor BamB
MGAVLWLARAVAAPGLATAQDWTTSGYDAQRSSWVRGDARISPDSLRKAGFQLLWMLRVWADASAPRAVTPPVLLDFMIGYRGFRSLGFVGGSGDHVAAVDTDLGRVEWERRLTATEATHLPACAASLTPGLALPTNPGLVSLVAAAGTRVAEPARSAVGNPGEGAVTLAELEARRKTAPPAAPKPPRPRPSAHPYPVVYAVASDGTLHRLNVMNGADAELPVPFLPPYARAHGLTVVDDVAYVVTSRGCGAAPSAVWALNLETKAVATWRAPSQLVGSSGPAFGPDGTLYVATSGGLVAALTPRTLASVDLTRSRGASYASSLVMFAHHDRLLAATATRSGPVLLFEAHGLKALKGPTLRGAVPRVAGALASWRDTTDTRWLLTPTADPVPAGAEFAHPGGAVTRGAIVAWKVVDQDSGPVLGAGWVSRDISRPLAPIVVNGVVFAVARGGGRPASATGGERVTPAVLYALDGVTGEELWNSGAAMASVASGGLAAGGGRVYVTTEDGAVYAFGFPMEH